MTLGDLITRLKRLPPDLAIKFDFVYFYPTGEFCSYRGSYEMLALNYSNTDKPLTVGEFLPLLEKQIGAVHVGWKGGQYRMGLDTELRVANRGEAGDTRIVRATYDEVFCLLITESGGL